MGITPLKWLLERSSVWSVPSFPNVSGRGPNMALFCRRLLKNIQVSNSNSKFSYSNIKFKKTNYKKNATNLIVKILPIRECLLSYTDTRLVRFPMLVDNVLGRIWLGTPLCHTIYIKIKLVFKHIPRRHHQTKTL